MAEVHAVDGRAGVTLKITADDTSNSLVTDGNLPMALVVSGTTFDRKFVISAVTITCETNPLRFTFGVAATQAGLGHVLTAGSSLKISNAASINAFRYISQNNGSAAVLQVTPEYIVSS